jgi:hypothetical protein
MIPKTGKIEYGKRQDEGIAKHSKDIERAKKEKISTFALPSLSEIFPAG